MTITAISITQVTIADLFFLLKQNTSDSALLLNRESLAYYTEKLLYPVLLSCNAEKSE